MKHGCHEPRPDSYSRRHKVSRVVGLAAAGLLATLTVGCTPHAPVAVRPGPASEPEVLYTACTPAPVKVVEIVAVEANWGDHSPRLWKIEFPNGTRLTSFVVGQTPDGGVERVRWQAPEDDTGLAARLVLEGEVGIYEGFDLEQLKAGEVVFHNRSISNDEFEKASTCR